MIGKGQRFEHDCKECKFIGQAGEADVWTHSTLKDGKLKITVIRRRSSEGSDYSAKEYYAL